MEPKKPMLKNWKFWGGLILVLLLLKSCGSGSTAPTEDEPTPTEPQEVAEQVDSEPEEAPAEDENKEREWHEVTKITGSMFKNSDPFTITGDMWRVSWNNPEDNDITIYSKKVGGIGLCGLFANGEPQGTGSDTCDEAGEFFLEINTLSENWEVTVEEYK